MSENPSTAIGCDLQTLKLIISFFYLISSGHHHLTALPIIHSTGLVPKKRQMLNKGKDNMISSEHSPSAKVAVFKIWVLDCSPHGFCLLTKGQVSSQESEHVPLWFFCS